MIKCNSPLVESTRLRMLMTENLLSALNYQCWGNSNDSPSNYIDLDTLERFREMLDRSNDYLKELFTAYEIYEKPCRD